MLDFSQYFQTATKKFNIPFKELNDLWREIDSDITCGKIDPQELWKKAIDKFNLKNAENYDFVKSWMNDYKARPKIHELAKKLSRKYKIGLISNLYEGMMPELINLGLVPNLDYSTVVLSYEIGLDKSGKEIYKVATEKSGVKPEEIFYIDDRKDFLENANSIGWQTAWFDVKNIDKTIKDIEKLLKI